MGFAPKQGLRHSVRVVDNRPMTAPPLFASIREYGSRLGDVSFWWPYVTEILGRHDLTDAGQELVAGFNPTYPTFLCGDVVVKLFGYFQTWRESHTAEREAQRFWPSTPRSPRPACCQRGSCTTMSMLRGHI